MSNGVLVAIVLGIFVGIVWLGLSQFLKVAGIFESFLENFGVLWWIAKLASYVAVFLFVWILGHVKPSSVIKWLFDKLLKRKIEERNWLFGVRIKNFLGGYPVGLVSKVYVNDEGKMVYNIVFLNLGGIWTFKGVPVEDTERTKESAEEIIQTTFSAGFL